MVQASLFSVSSTLFYYYFHSAFFVSLLSESFALENPETKYSSFPIPKNVSIIGSSQRSIALIWDLPPSDKIIHGYHLFYMHETFKDVKTIRTSSPSYNLTRLEPYTTYTVWVTALVEDNNSSTVVETDKSIVIKAHTDVNEPSAPRNMSVTCCNTGVLYIQWKRPLYFNKSVDYYYIYYKRKDDSLYEHIAIQADSKENNDFFIKELRGIYSYSIKICAGTNSVFDEGKFTWKGPFSKEVSVYLPKRGCFRENFKYSPGLLIGLLVSYLVIIAVIFLIFWCVDKDEQKKEEDEKRRQQQKEEDEKQQQKEKEEQEIKEKQRKIEQRQKELEQKQKIDDLQQKVQQIEVLEQKVREQQQQIEQQRQKKLN